MVQNKAVLLGDRYLRMFTQLRHGSQTICNIYNVRIYNLRRCIYHSFSTFAAIFV